MGLLGRALQGRAVVDSTELVSFLLSPRGTLILLLAAMIWLTIKLAELLDIASGNIGPNIELK